MRHKKNIRIQLLKYILSISSSNVFNQFEHTGFWAKTHSFAEVHIKKSFVKQKFIMLTKLLQNTEGKNISFYIVSMVRNCFV